MAKRKYPALTPEQAIAAIRENCRAIVAPAFAETITLAFGYTLADLDITPQRADRFYRVTIHPGKHAMSSVGIQSVAARLSVAVAGTDPREAYSSPFFGTGTSAEHISRQAAKALEAHLATRIIQRARDAGAAI